MSDLSEMRQLTRATRQYEAVLERTGLKGKDIREEIQKIQDYINMVERLMKAMELAQVLMSTSELTNPLTAPFAVFRLGALTSSMALSEGSLGGR